MLAVEPSTMTTRRPWNSQSRDWCVSMAVSGLPNQPRKERVRQPPPGFAVPAGSPASTSAEPRAVRQASSLATTARQE